MEYEPYLKRYLELVQRGICAHTAICSVMSAQYTDLKDQGFSQDMAFQENRGLLKAIRKLQEDI